jgi:hypothetical protein
MKTTMARDKPKRTVQRFHYSLEYEHALMNLLGPSYYGRAGLAANVSFLKKTMLKLES